MTFPDPAGYSFTPWTDPNGIQWIFNSVKGRWARYRVAATGGGADLSDDTPEPLGTASAGTSDEASRSDHVHAMPSAADVGAVAEGDAITILRATGGISLQIENNGADDIQTVVVDPSSLSLGTTRVLANSLGADRTWDEPDASGVRALTGNASGEPDKLTQGTVSGYTENAVAIGTVTTSHTLDIATSTYQSVQLTASTACTFTMPTAAFGKSFVLIVRQAAATGNGTAIFTGVDWGGAGTYAATATAGKEDALTFWATATSGGYKWRGAYQKGYTT